MPLDAEYRNEEARLRVLTNYRILDTAPSERFDRTARLIADAMRVPYLLITFVDRTRSWRRSVVGLPQCDVPLDKSFSSFVIQSHKLVAIPDIRKEERFAGHPLVEGEPHLASYAGVPLVNADGWALGVLGVWDDKPRTFEHHELTTLSALAEMVVAELELHKALLISELTSERLGASEALFRGMFDNASVGMAISRPDGVRIAVNERFISLLGSSRDELLALPMWDITHPDDVEAGRQLMQELVDGKRDAFMREKRIILKNGEEHWVEVYAGINRNGAGVPLSVVSIYVSIDERKLAEFTRNLLLGEVNHRVKNTLAIIQGMAKQMQRTVSSPSEFSAAFEQRLHAVAKSHDMLTDANWQPLLMSDVIVAEIDNLASGFRDRITIDCPEVRLRSQIAVILGLMMHELTINAIKYGALKTEQGQVSITVRLIETSAVRSVELIWTEQCGVPVAAPKRSGFGRFMLERGVRGGLSGESSIAFEPQGLCYRCAFPLY